MPPHAPPPASLAEVACSGKQTARHLADRACARARAASTAGFCSAPFLGLRNPRLTKSCSRHLAAPPPPAPAESPFSFLHSQHPYPAPIPACPGPQQPKPHHLHPHILHAGRAAVPTSVLKAEVVGGVGGGAGRAGERTGIGRDAAGPVPRLWAPAVLWILPEGGRRGLIVAFALEG